MKKTKILTGAYQKLMNKALEACDNAYAPYSKFHVGAAVLLNSGKIIKGHNIENAAYPMCLCAERTALATCSILHPFDPPKAVAVHAKVNGSIVDDVVSPCGACRQVISEMEKRYNTNIEIIFPLNSNEYVLLSTIENLIPYSFSGKTLPKK